MAKSKTQLSSVLGLSPREEVIFDLLRAQKVASSDDILVRLTEEKLKLQGKRNSHILNTLMKYLTAKACQKGYIISMIHGGRGPGNKAVYSMTKRF